MSKFQRTAYHHALDASVEMYFLVGKIVKKHTQNQNLERRKRFIISKKPVC